MSFFLSILLLLNNMTSTIIDEYQYYGSYVEDGHLICLCLDEEKKSYNLDVNIQSNEIKIQTISWELFNTFQKEAVDKEYHKTIIEEKFNFQKNFVSLDSTASYNDLIVSLYYFEDEIHKTKNILVFEDSNNIYVSVLDKYAKDILFVDDVFIIIYEEDNGFSINKTYKIIFE